MIFHAVDQVESWEYGEEQVHGKQIEVDSPPKALIIHKIKNYS